MDGIGGSSFDEMDCLSDIYTLEQIHYSLLKDNFRIKHMEAMNESYDIILEAMSDMFSNMGKFFKKMVDAIKEFFKKIFMYISSYFMDIDKFVKTYKDKLSQINDVKFTINGFKFNLETKPDLTEFNNIVDSYNAGLSDIPKMKRDDILKEQKAYMDTNHLNALRTQVLGTDGGNMNEDDLAEIARKFYRNGETDPIELTIDTARFKQALTDAEKLSKGKKDAEKLRDKTISMFNKAEKFFSTDVNVIYKNGDKTITNDKVSADVSKGEFKVSGLDDRVYNSHGSATTASTFIRFKYNQTHELAIISNIVVREYANAYKDAVKMTREIIRRGVSKPKDNTTDNVNKNQEG